MKSPILLLRDGDFLARTATVFVAIYRELG
jgi:hypothetical protein